MRKTCSRLTSGVFTAAHFLPSVFLGLFIDCCLISLRWLRERTGCQSSLSGGGVARRSASVCFYQRIKQFYQTSAFFFFPSSPFHVKSRFKRLAVTAGFLRVFFFFFSPWLSAWLAFPAGQIDSALPRATQRP